MILNSSASPFKRLQDESGTVLIITLLVIVTLIGLTVAFSEDTGIELQLAGYARDNYLAYQAARTGVHQALDAIGRDENVEMDSFRDVWAEAAAVALTEELSDEVSVLGVVADESGKFNLNFLLSAEGEIDSEQEQQLNRLLQAIDVDEELAAPILDWLDSDDIERMNGAETAYYRSLPEPYPCSNGPFITTGQLMMVKGLAQSALMNYVTVFSDGLININTAPKEVLQSLSEKMTASLAEAIIAFRETADFMTVDDLKKIAGMDAALFAEIKDRVSVKSAAFSIEYEGRYRDTATVIKAVAVRNEKKVNLLYWRVD